MKFLLLVLVSSVVGFKLQVPFSDKVSDIFNKTEEQVEGAVDSVTDTVSSIATKRLYTDFFKNTAVQEAGSLANASSLTYTTDYGAPYWQPFGVQRAGPDGPLLMQDVHHLDNLAHFARERTPERVVHAKGAAAHGYFEATTDFAEKYSVAEIFKKGTVTSTTVRFSTVIGFKGSADQARDPRGMAIKFRTKKGILDWVFNNTPVFFMRDPTKFPLFIHSQKPDPVSNTRNWDSY